MWFSEEAHAKLLLKRVRVRLAFSKQVSLGYMSCRDAAKTDRLVNGYSLTTLYDQTRQERGGVRN